MEKIPTKWTEETQGEIIRLIGQSGLSRNSYLFLKCVVSYYCHNHRHAYKQISSIVLTQIYVGNIAKTYGTFEAEGVNRLDSAIIYGAALTAATVEDWWQKVVS
jgi:hypothetical protein